MPAERAYNPMGLMKTMPAQEQGGGPRRLAELLGQVCSRLGLQRDLDDYRLWQAWDEVVGPLVARNAQPIRLDGRRLVVAVRSTTWMQELSLLRHDLCGRLNAWMAREIISDILLVVGRVEAPSATSTVPPRAACTRRPQLLDRDRSRRETSEQTRTRLEAAIDKLWQAARRGSGG